MTKAKRRMVITIETHQHTLVRSRRKPFVAWCAECGAEVWMVSVDGAAREAGANELEIYKLVETRALHFSEDSEGRVLVCLKSLGRLRRFSPEEER